MASSNYVSVKEWMAPYMPQNRFPLMGFPGERNKRDGMVVYQCFFPTARIALWTLVAGGYELNLYRPFPDDAHRDDTLTDHCDRYAKHQAPIFVNDAFEAQLAIFYLVQTYLPGDLLPLEVTHDVSDAYKEERPRANLAAGQDGDVRTHSRTS